MPLYADPNITDVTDVFNYTNANACVNVNDPATCGMFGVMILFGIFAIVFISQKDTQPTVNAFALSSFISFVISVFLLILAWIPSWANLLFLVLTALSGIMLLKGE